METEVRVGLIAEYKSVWSTANALIKANLVLGDNTSGFPINHIEQRLPLGVPVCDGIKDIAMEGDGQAMPYIGTVTFSNQRRVGKTHHLMLACQMHKTKYFSVRQEL